MGESAAPLGWLPGATAPPLRGPATPAILNPHGTVKQMIIDNIA